MLFRAKHAGVDWMTGPVRSCSHQDIRVAAEAISAQIAVAVFVKMEGREGAVQSALEIAEQGVDPADMR